MAEIIRSAALDGIPHGFSARDGVRGSDVLPGAEVARLAQVHSAQVWTLSECPDDLREGDALVTDRPGLLLGIVTADCAPVLLADREAGVVGAAHAGWRGARAGVLENTVGEMERLGARPERIAAAIGPTIAQRSYEVDRVFRARFGDGDAQFFAPGKGERMQFDLPGYVAHRLAAAGVGQIDDLGLDTYADPARFHSYRRATHRGESSHGRQVSLIGLLP